MENLKRLYDKLKEPREFTSMDALSIYFGLAYLFFYISFN